MLDLVERAIREVVDRAEEEEQPSWRACEGAMVEMLVRWIDAGSFKPGFVHFATIADGKAVGWSLPLERLLALLDASAPEMQAACMAGLTGGAPALRWVTDIGRVPVLLAVAGEGRARCILAAMPPADVED